MISLWRFLSGPRSSPSRSKTNRRPSARAAHGRQYEVGMAFKESVGGPNASPRVSDSSIHFSPGRIVFAVLVFVGFVWVGWRIIAGTAASNASATDPGTAVAWMPNEPEALDELAFREFTKTGGDLDIARNLAERALRSSPLDARALLLLGLIADRQGDHERGESLIRLSASRTWRDTATQAWLVNRDIQRREFDQALSHIDALMRVNPEFVSPEVLEQTFPVLAAFTIDQGTFKVLASFLAAAPPWRAAFLTLLSTRLSNADRLVQLYAILKDSQHPPDSKELKPFLDRLIKDGRFADAYQSWRETLPPQQRLREAYPYNGDFAAPIDGLPFNWVLQPTPGMDIQVVTSLGEPESRALQFQFSGTRLGVFTVGQLMLLPPGEYRLTGKVRAEALRTQRGLRWQVSCTESPQNTLALTSLVANATPWTTFSADFTVPAKDCAGQRLNLEIPSRTASEREIEGQIWYENMQIVRIGQSRSPDLH